MDMDIGNPIIGKQPFERVLDLWTFDDLRADQHILVVIGPHRKQPARDPEYETLSTEAIRRVCYLVRFLRKSCLVRNWELRFYSTEVHLGRGLALGRTTFRFGNSLGIGRCQVAQLYRQNLDDLPDTMERALPRGSG
jgi:hypothetical protein